MQSSSWKLNAINFRLRTCVKPSVLKKVVFWLEEMYCCISKIFFLPRYKFRPRGDSGRFVGKWRVGKKLGSLWFGRFVFSKLLPYHAHLDLFFFRREYSHFKRTRKSVVLCTVCRIYLLSSSSALTFVKLYVLPLSQLEVLCRPMLRFLSQIKISINFCKYITLNINIVLLVYRVSCEISRFNLKSTLSTWTQNYKSLLVR